MKLINLTIAFLLFSNIIFAQYTLIPDVNFEKVLINYKYDTGTPDGKVLTSNINSVKSLGLYENNISDLTGIEDFTSLEILECVNNCVDSLDLSNNLSLKKLDCSGNKLFFLNVSNNINLNILNCDWNLFSEIDISKNVNLTDFNCYYNKIINIDVTNNINLKTLSCSDNLLTKLDVSKNINLENLDFFNNKITAIDVSKCTKLKTLSFSHNSISILDVSNNVNLTELYCYSNKISKLDLTNNVSLLKLDCGTNKLSNLDVSKNLLLKELICNGNLLTELNLFNNINLYTFSCDWNSIKKLDVSKNINLTYINCGWNLLTALDLSKNTKLKRIWCYTNKLKTLNIKNGNNSIITSLEANNNFALFCITVDNPIYSIFKWTNTTNFKKDSWSQYTDEICGTNVISGNTFYDANLNCTKETTEKGMRKIIVKADGETDFYASTDNSGNYRILVDSNKTYNVNAVAFTDLKLMKSSCPDSGFVVNSGVGGTITANKNFALDIKQCAMLSVEIAKGELRRCFPSNTVIWYKNIGTMDETNAKIFIDYPEYVKIVSANKTYNLVDAEKNIYVFDIGTIAAFGSGTLNIVDSVVCGNESIRGLTQCIKTWITPKSYCAETKDTTAWDKSSIKVYEVFCIGDSARFTITNAGSGDMLNFHDYRIYLNNELAYTGHFKLKSGENLYVTIPSDGSTIRLEADQHPLHPGNSKPRTSIEACGNSENVSLGFWTQTENDDLDYDISEVCLEILDSYDPNDKKVLPAGITAEHYVSETGELKYTIRFQNTGSAEAIKIMVVDTLSENLDISTLNILGASHSYDYNVTGTNSKVLTFTFNNINLPDSTTNEAASHGFVSYSISPIQGITKGTKIENFADIYFDYNSAVRTDTAWVTALDTVITSSKIITVTEQSTLGISNVNVSKVQIYPNPTNEFLFVKNANSEFSKIEFFDIKGSLILTENLISDEQKINVNSLQKGIFFIHLSNEKGEMKTFKMVK